MTIRRSLALALPLAIVITAPAQAHRAWLLPSATVLSGNSDWVTVDAAISNDLFYFEHNPMQLTGLAITAPDGSAVQPQNAGTGRYRSTFDVQLTQKGTYKIANVSNGAFASYKLNGETKRLRDAPDKIVAKIPAGAQEVVITEAQNRNETFVTAGSPTATVLKPTGVGLELASVTHPNDLVAGEPATFGFLLDGKPAAGIKVAVVPGGIRYRDQLGEMQLVADAQGRVVVTWPQPGMYWLQASATDNKVALPQAKERRATYAATFEVLAP